MHTHRNNDSESPTKGSTAARRVADRAGKVTGPSSVNSTTLKCDRVEKLLHGLKVILSHHGAPSKVVASFYKQAYDYLIAAPREEVFIKRAKDMMLVPMSKYLRNELPEVPDLRFHPRGSWLRWSRQRLRSFRAKNTHLWFSFLQGKRAAAQVSPEIVLANYQKHRDQMLSPDPIGWTEEGDGFIEDIMEVLKPLSIRIRKEFRRKNLRNFREPWTHTYSASEHAALESSRKTGGQKGYLRELEGLGPDDTYIPLVRGDLESMTHHTGLRIRDESLVVNPVTEVRVVPTEREFLKDRLREYATRDRRGPLEARVEAVLEPLKVRTISKGPSVEYDAAKPVQKDLHSILRKMNPFRLIGRPMRVGDLTDIRRAQEQIGSLEDHEWLSIDYSSATDGLSARLSEAILDSILSSLAFENLGYYLMLKQVLAPHRISYPMVAGVQLESVEQQNGQLMGSPLSFPVLCIANLALYLMVRKQTRPEASFKDLLDAVLINGDDMIYIGTEEEWRLHHELGAKFGLAMSPGKAYKHVSYANINSVCVHYDLRWESTPKVIPFFNVGLLVGNHKVLGKVETHNLSKKLDSKVALSKDEVKLGCPVTSCLGEVIHGALPGREKDLCKMYLAIHKDAIRAESRGRNVFLPTSVGGLGQPCPLGFRTVITDEQVALALDIWARKPYLVPNVRPFNRGRELNEVQDLVLEPLGLSVLPEELDDEGWLTKRIDAVSQLRRLLLFGLAPYQFDE
nr:RNA-dependent RNA polymerase [Mute swan feces associated narna-like virus 2]